MSGYGEQCADTDGLAMYLVSDGNETQCARCGSMSHDAEDCPVVEARENALERECARLNKHITGQDAMIAGLRTEIERLSARHGVVGDPQTGARPSETPSANPFAYGWATNWKMR